MKTTLCCWIKIVTLWHPYSFFIFILGTSIILIIFFFQFLINKKFLFSKNTGKNCLQVLFERKIRKVFKFFEANLEHLIFLLMRVKFTCVRKPRHLVTSCHDSHFNSWTVSYLQPLHVQSFEKFSDGNKINDKFCLLSLWKSSRETTILYHCVIFSQIIFIQEKKHTDKEICL